MTATRRAWIALGANLGDRRRNIETALLRLAQTPSVRVVEASALIETEAVTAPGAPAQPAFLNAAAELATTLSPRALLRAMLAIEQAMGRIRTTAKRWAPRAIDLDLLLYEELTIHEPGLVVPHPRMHSRRFVLEPLAQIAPDLVHPALGATIEELLAGLTQIAAPGRL